jgi:hypothetical protein
MVQYPHEDCSDSSKDFQSDATMRQHHTKVHDEKLPNCECDECEKEFFKKNGRRKYCDDCKYDSHYKGENNPNYKGKIDYVKDIKKHRICSENGCKESRPEALCFHHNPEYKKRDSVSRMAITSKYSLEDLKQEIQKCELICQNCHRERHADTQRFNGKSQDTDDKNTKAGLVRTLKKEGSCSNEDCDESQPYCLDFHHIKEENKNASIDKIVGEGDMKELKSELEKCELLCVNCHMIKHSTRQSPHE